MTLTAPTSCPACGEVIDAGAQFCEACGTPLTPAAATGAPAPTAAAPAPVDPPPAVATAPALAPPSLAEAVATGPGMSGGGPLDPGLSGPPPGALLAPGPGAPPAFAPGSPPGLAPGGPFTPVPTASPAPAASPTTPASPTPPATPALSESSAPASGGATVLGANSPAATPGEVSEPGAQAPAAPVDPTPAAEPGVAVEPTAAGEPSAAVKDGAAVESSAAAEPTAVADPAALADPTAPTDPASADLAPAVLPPADLADVQPVAGVVQPAASTPREVIPGEESPLDIGWTGVVPGADSAYELTPPEPVTCASCGQGTYLDGYCDNCGSKEPNPRDHLEEAPSDWVAGVSDIGRRHTRNEDALALSAGTDRAAGAVLVVCDGVSNTTDSDAASLAAAKAARAVLDKPLSTGMGVADAVRAAAIKRLADAVAAANSAVVAMTIAGDPKAPSCTFTGAIVAGETAYVGNVGDSRIYWLPDEGEPVQLSTDDSVAAARIAAGVERKEAETGPMAHSITRWLGSDAPEDLTPHTATIELTSAGWLMLCSDGLWNYCSTAAELRERVAQTISGGTEAQPLALAKELVNFANESGGVDNITVALARITAPGTDSATDLAGSGEKEGS